MLGKILIAVVAVVGLMVGPMLIYGASQNLLPRQLMPAIENNVVYSGSMTSDDWGWGGPSGEHRNYRIPLEAGKLLMVDASSERIFARFKLFNDDGQMLEDMPCSFQPYCRFFVDVRKSGWGILRISASSNGGEKEFAVETRYVGGASSSGGVSSRNADAPMPPKLQILNLNELYRGEMLKSDLPGYRNDGAMQSYGLRLNAGQVVMIRAKSEEVSLSLSVHDQDGRLDMKTSRGGGIRKLACLPIKAPENGVYSMQVMSEGTGEARLGRFTLEVFDITSDDQFCDEFSLELFKWRNGIDRDQPVVSESNKAKEML